MIEAVGTSSVNLAALRSASQGPVSASFAATPAASSASQYFISSRVRMDNLLDMAILEVRAAETGDIIRQYPTENQIRAFQRASELDARQTEAASSQAQRARQEALLQQETAAVHASSVQVQAAPVAQQAPAPAAAPAASAAASYGGGEGASAPAQHTVSTLA